MLDLSDSKGNAKMLVERFLETGEQPDFMEFLCFRNFFIEAEFYAYGAEYVVSNFHIYACIVEDTEPMQDSIIGDLKKVENYYCPCDGEDVIKEAKRYDIDFAMINGHLQFIKEQKKEEQELEYDKYGYHSRRGIRAA